MSRIRTTAAVLAAAVTLAAARPTAAQLVAYELELPRVMVFIDEEGRTATSAITSFLREAGFTVIDPAFARTASEQDVAQRALAGDDAAATELGRDLGAHVVLLGAVPSEDQPSPADDRLRVATAHLSVRALRLDRTRVVSSQQADARGLDATGLGARQKAVRQAVEDALYRTSFVGDLLIDWEEERWEDDEYWEPAPGSVEAQIVIPPPPPPVGAPGDPLAPAPQGGSPAVTTGTVVEPQLPTPQGPPRIAIFESESYPLPEGTRGIEIVGVEPRIARIRGLVTRPDAVVTVGGVEASLTPLSADEAMRLGLVGPGVSFEARVPLGPGEDQVEVAAASPGGEATVAVSPGVGERWAVVIGISEYADARITPLRYADDDARAMYDFLRSEPGGSVPERNIRLLVNEDATAEAIREALFVFLQQARAEDMVTVYLASHGAPDPTRDSNLYVLTHDTDVDAMAATAFPMWDVKTALRRQIAAERVVVIADACRSAGTLVDDANPVGGAFSELFTPSRRMTMSAAGMHEVSFEDARWGGGHGVFTHYLLEGLGGAADADGDGVVSFREAAAYVEAHVPGATDGVQNPEWSGLGDLALARLPRAPQ